MRQGSGELLAIDEDFDVEEDDRDYRHPRVTPRENDSVEHPAGTMQVQLPLPPQSFVYVNGLH